MSKPYASLVVMVLCAACGSKFDATGSGEAGASGAGVAGGEASGGRTSSAGSSSGGATEAGAGGTTTSAGAGGTTTAGAGGSVVGLGGSGGSVVGSGGSGGSVVGSGGSGGSVVGSGGSAGADCAALKTEYAALVQKARVCDKGSTNECSPSSTLPAVGCGCPVLVNSKSADKTLAEQKYKAIEANKCNLGPICASACVQYSGADCTAQSATPGGDFTCTATSAVQPN
jgi:hypothetical protein